MYDIYLIANLLRVGLYRRKVISVLWVFRFAGLSRMLIQWVELSHL